MSTGPLLSWSWAGYDAVVAELGDPGLPEPAPVEPPPAPEPTVVTLPAGYQPAVAYRGASSTAAVPATGPIQLPAGATAWSARETS